MNKRLFISCAALLSLHLCPASELILPAPMFERDQKVVAIYRTGLQATGKAQLHILWSDSYGRQVEDRTLQLTLSDEREVRFVLDLRRAVAMQNEVRVHFLFDGLNKKGEKDHREEDASATFVARPADNAWRDYAVIMWQNGTAEHFRKLQEVGANAGKSAEHSAALPDSLLQDNLRWYVENMATDFYSSYHIYRPDRPYNYALLEAKAEYKKDPGSREALKRYPSFEDPAWIAKVQERIVAATRVYSPYRPIFYNLADESGIAELAGFWDFDFSDYSLGAMRKWLQTQYGTLPALNNQWKANFTTWDEVTPETTREAMKRADDNFSSWADFKQWMDVSFSNALKMGADAVHSVDPAAFVGIEGAQMPGWGGYDYYRLSTTLQAMEPYDIGNNIEIIRSINPQLAFVTTAFAQGPWEKHRLWYELLHGARGHIIWDEKNDIVTPEGAIGSRGEDVAANWRELRGGIGALLIQSVRQAGPIAIHYSQASMRTDWMLKHRNDGDTWMDRMSWHERKDSDFLALRNSYCHLIEDEGLQYKFVAYAQVEQGELLKGGYRALILPRSNSLSPAEAAEITAFVQQGGTLIVDGEAGTFDEHSRRLAKSSLVDLLAGAKGRGQVMRFDALKYAQQRILGSQAAMHVDMHRILNEAGIHPAFAALDRVGMPIVGLETHEFRNGGVTVVALHNNPQMSIDDLGQPDAAEELKSKKRFENSYSARLIAPTEFYAYDVRKGKPLGRVKQLSLTVDPYEPSIVAFSPTPLPDLQVSAPEKVARGSLAQVGIAMNGSPAAAHVFHVDVFDPKGKSVDYYSGNVAAYGGVGQQMLAIAQNAALGNWTVTIRDVLSGQTASRTIEVF